MLRQLKNKDGVVFVTVLAIIITMMVLAVSIIGMNVSQTTISEREVKRLKAEILTAGALSYAYANQLSSSPASSIVYNQILDNINYNITIQLDPPDGSTPASSPDVQYLTIDTDY